jgi:hypothetical protein
LRAVTGAGEWLLGGLNGNVVLTVPPPPWRQQPPEQKMARKYSCYRLSALDQVICATAQPPLAPSRTRMEISGFPEQRMR